MSKSFYTCAICGKQLDTGDYMIVGIQKKTMANIAVCRGQCEKEVYRLITDNNIIAEKARSY